MQGSMLDNNFDSPNKPKVTYEIEESTCLKISKSIQNQPKPSLKAKQKTLYENFTLFSNRPHKPQQF
jgi:hypothetical protein